MRKKTPKIINALDSPDAEMVEWPSEESSPRWFSIAPEDFGSLKGKKKPVSQFPKKNPDETPSEDIWDAARRVLSPYEYHIVELRYRFNLPVKDIARGLGTDPSLISHTEEEAVKCLKGHVGKLFGTQF